MYNYCFLVGRLVRDVKPLTSENGKTYAYATLAVNRPFKNNTTNQFDVDFIDVFIWDFVCDPVVEYVHKGDMIGVKGRIEPREREANGQRYTTQEIIAEKVIFLGTSKKNMKD